MKRILIPLLGLLLAAPAAAQLTAGRIYRSEFVTYDTREAAESRDRTGSSRYVPLRPAPFTASDGTIGLGQVIDVPSAWTDGAVYLHLENTGSPYTLLINGRPVAEVEDALTPADFYVSPFLKEGPNVVLLDLRDSRTPELQRGFIPAPAEPFANSYVLCQDKRSVVDFSAALVPDSTRRFGVLDLQIVVMNGFNYPEPVTVGYDLYDPTGKLLDFSINEVTVDGRSTDTVRFHPYVYHTYEHPWPGRNAPLYRLMLYTKRDGALREYIPLRLGFGTTGIEEGRLMRLGSEIAVREATYNAAGDPATTRKQLEALRASGVNMLFPDYPQPYWFYDLCDEMGLMVVDQAAINAPDRKEDRRIGGTPSNDPALLGEYMDRIRGMYFRSRNHPSVAGFALGSDSGNGYNMYKAYQWLKEAEPQRFVIYLDADGEWNTDL